MRRPRHAFTLVEILVVISIIMLLASLLVPIVAIVMKKSRETAGTCVLEAMTGALITYYNDFDDYPPDDTPSTDRNECLAYYLTSSFKIGERRVGPYLPTNQRQTRDADGDGLWELISPMGGKYEYRRLHGPGNLAIYMIIDPGHDLKLGGSIDPSSGFIPDGSGAEKDNMVRKGQR